MGSWAQGARTAALPAPFSIGPDCAFSLVFPTVGSSCTAQRPAGYMAVSRAFEWTGPLKLNKGPLQNFRGEGGNLHNPLCPLCVLSLGAGDLQSWFKPGTPDAKQLPTLP